MFFSGDLKKKKLQKTSHCIIIFVALNALGKPQTVSKWIPKTKADQDLHDYAKRLVELRKDIHNEMKDRQIPEI